MSARSFSFEPLGEEIDCGADETVLDAAFRQGYNLAHGCREGQCSACKCYLLEGEVELERYSTFALSDTERAERLRAHVPGAAGVRRGDRAAALRPRQLPPRERDPRRRRRGGGAPELTHDIVGLTLSSPDDFSWLPGQYVDVHVPGTDGVRRSFSIANLPSHSSPSS